MLKYEVEGENNMPFELSQIVVISTAEGIYADGDSIWNLDLVQNNDIYLHISKNKNYKETQIIKNITIDNFTINKEPQIGEIVIYRPSRNENKNYEYLEEYKVSNSIIYYGKEEANFKELEIANQGGVLSIRYTLEDIRKI